MNTNCCRKCSKKFCEMRNQIENCKDCVSYVWLAMQEIDKKLDYKEKEEDDYGNWITISKNCRMRNKFLRGITFYIKEKEK